MAPGWMGGLKTAARIMGPAFLVSVAYMDPGNWAVSIEAGSRFGYQLVWVVVLSNLIAIQLQTLAARLGLVTGKNLAQVCRESYPRAVCVLLWLLSEVSIVALDATMVVGTAVGLNLLFKLPLLPAILATSLDGLLLLLLVPRRAVRSSELLTVGLLAVVVLCFIIDLVVSRPQLTLVVGGLVPRLQRDSVATAVSIVGANIMPHSFFLHSALVSGQARGQPPQALHSLLWYNTLDVACALGVALVVNVAILLVSAATFHEAGIVVETLQAAHDMMEKTLSSSVAPAAFGTALLCAGQLSTFTGTIAGQVVLRGFMNVRLSTLTRRLVTRMAAILPAAVLQALWGDKGTYKFLLVAQVVLALQLPFTLVPLIKATSSRRLMGPFRNGWLTAVGAWGAGAAVFLANVLLFAAQLAPGAAFLPVAREGVPDSGVHQYLDDVAALAWERPGRFLLMVGMLVAAAALLSLQLWMVMTPLGAEGPKAAAGKPPQPLRAPQGAAAWHHGRAEAAGGGGSSGRGGGGGGAGCGGGGSESEDGDDEWRHDGRGAGWHGQQAHHRLPRYASDGDEAFVQQQQQFQQQHYQGQQRQEQMRGQGAAPEEPRGCWPGSRPTDVELELAVVMAGGDDNCDDEHGDGGEGDPLLLPRLQPPQPPFFSGLSSEQQQQQRHHGRQRQADEQGEPRAQLALNLPPLRQPAPPAPRGPMPRAWLRWLFPGARGAGASSRDEAAAGDGTLRQLLPGPRASATGAGPPPWQQKPPALAAATAAAGPGGAALEGTPEGAQLDFEVPDSWDDLAAEDYPLRSPASSLAASSEFAGGGAAPFEESWVAPLSPSPSDSTLSDYSAALSIPHSYASSSGFASAAAERSGGAADASTSLPSTPRSAGSGVWGAAGGAGAAAREHQQLQWQWQQQQQQQQKQKHLAGSASLAMSLDRPVVPPPSGGSAGALATLGAASAVPGALPAAAAGPSAGQGRLSKSQRRKFAAVLDSFWSHFYDSHGRLQQQQQQQQQQGTGPEQREQQQPLSPLSCSHGRSAGSAPCGACCDALLGRIRGCMEDLMRIEGAATVLQSEEGGIPSVAAPGAADGLPLPQQARAAFWPDAILTCGAASRHLQTVAALAKGNVPWALASAAAPVPAVDWDGGGGGAGPEGGASGTPGGQWQWQGLLLGPMQSAQQQQQQQQQQGEQLQEQTIRQDSGGQLVNRGELGAALFVSWGIWCALVLLVWCQVEVRPELLGAYAPTLNRLQGLLADAGLEPGAPPPGDGAGADANDAAAAGTPQGASLQQQEQQEQRPVWWPWPLLEGRLLRHLLLGQLAALEAVIHERQPAAGSGAATAYTAAKRIMHSVVKRLRRQLLHGRAHQPHQQQQEHQQHTHRRRFEDDSWGDTQQQRQPGGHPHHMGAYRNQQPPAGDRSGRQRAGGAARPGGRAGAAASGRGVRGGMPMLLAMPLLLAGSLMVACAWQAGSGMGAPVGALLRRML